MPPRKSNVTRWSVWTIRSWSWPIRTLLPKFEERFSSPFSLSLSRTVRYLGEKCVHHVFKSLLHRYRSGNERDLQQSTYLHSDRKILLSGYWKSELNVFVGKIASRKGNVLVDYKDNRSPASGKICPGDHDRADDPILQFALFRTILSSTGIPTRKAILARRREGDFRISICLMIVAPMRSRRRSSPIGRY